MIDFHYSDNLNLKQGWFSYNIFSDFWSGSLPDINSETLLLLISLLQEAFKFKLLSYKS